MRHLQTQDLLHRLLSYTSDWHINVKCKLSSFPMQKKVLILIGIDGGLP